MIAVLAALILLLGLFLSAFFSGTETGLYCVNRLRLHLGVQDRDPQALRVARLLKDEPGALSVTLVGTNLANFATTSALAFLMVHEFGASEHQAELSTIALLTPVVFVFGEVVPKSLFQRHADRLLLASSRLLAAFDRLFRLTGVVFVLKRLTRLFARLFGGVPSEEVVFAPKRRIARMLQEGLAGKTFAEEQSHLIERICRLSETALHTAMVPRNRVRALPADTDRRGLIRAARRTGYGRFPVYETNPRRITGLIDVDDLLRREDWKRVGECLEPVSFLSPHDSVATAIVRLQREKHGLAVVADRSGQMVGIVLLKDLLGRLVAGSALGD
ncbi:MAG: DUF21 domain-containing protein [Planctomycetota bacterium]|nr:MAG: DUF21 domain-containing protein [Planctomycetota bacterium]